MCGLFGFIGEKPDRDLIVELGYKAGTRGPHGYGVFTWSTYWTKEVHVHDDLQSLKGIAEPFIGHARLATFGRTFQPIVGNQCAIAHNGNIYQHKEIAKAHGIELKTDCDSEVLLRLFEASEGSPAERMKRVIEVVQPSNANAALIFGKGFIVAYRHRHPLYIGHRKEGVYFCSRPFEGAKLQEEGIESFEY